MSLLLVSVVFTLITFLHKTVGVVGDHSHSAVCEISQRYIAVHTLTNVSNVNSHQSPVDRQAETWETGSSVASFRLVVSTERCIR